MVDKYPFLEKIKKLLKEKDQNLGWLGAEIERSKRWLELIDSIDNVALLYIMRISKSLDFDFLADYYNWLGKESLPFVVNEPSINYERETPNDISIQITIRGSAEKAGEVLSKIKAETKKQGYKID